MYHIELLHLGGKLEFLSELLLLFCFIILLFVAIIIVTIRIFIIHYYILSLFFCNAIYP